MTALLKLPAETEYAHGVRAVEPAHVSGIARLFHKTFRGGRGAPPASLSAYFHALLFEHPWRDMELPSLVHVSAVGSVDGFMGVLPQSMTIGGKPVRAAIAGMLMADEPQKNPLTGARLLRAFFAGPQDISISETANPLSHGMWTRLGGSVLPLHSMEWFKVLRPFGAAAAVLSHGAPAAKILSPFASASDALLSRFKRNPFRFELPASAALIRGEDADEDRFIACALRFAAQFELRPCWNKTVLRWLLTKAAVKESHGPMMRRLVYGKGDAPIGGYIAYMRPKGVAWVLQILAEPGRAGPVLDNLAAYAHGHGAVALRGKTHPLLMEPLLTRGCLFLHRSSTLVHARDASLMAAASRNGLINGLAGETWSRHIGGEFR
jgi:hypothetical protein